MMNGCGTGKHLEGSGRGVIDVLSCHVPGVTKKTHENFHLGRLMTRPRLGPNIPNAGF